MAYTPSCPAPPTPSPSPTPTESEPEIKGVTSFDCIDHTSPMQVLKTDPDDEFYSLNELDYANGQWVVLNKLKQVPPGVRINAVGLYQSPHSGNYTMIAAMNHNLCAFDENSYHCFEDHLGTFSDKDGGEAKIANAGVVVGHNYYYGRNQPQYWVEGINTLNPVFHNELDYDIRYNWGRGNDKHNAAIMDFIAVDEGIYYTDQVIDNGDGESGLYLIGLSKNYMAYIFEINDDGTYGKYAVLQLEPDWGEHVPEEDQVVTAFGGAYKYKVGPLQMPQVMFSANSGAGLLELSFPLRLPSHCWFAGGTDHELVEMCQPLDGGKFEDQGELKWFAESAATKYNDGFNCPLKAPEGPEEVNPLDQNL